MLHAVIRGSREIVTAAKASRYGKYRCPTCNGEVFLKAGQYYKRHFAHMPGQGKPECENYHPFENLRRQLGTALARPSAGKIDGLLLSIELEPRHDARRGLRRWNLRLTVPKSYGPHGEIELDMGGGDVRRVPLSKLWLSSQTYPASPDAIEFGARRVSPEVRPEYRQAVESRIAGLNPRRATVFSVVPGILKPQSNGLQWGQSYYLVWRGDTIGALPPGLVQHEFADHRGWSCHLIVLPQRADSDVARSLEKTCELQITPAKREWALIYPAPYGLDDEGRLRICATGTLLLGIKSAAEEGNIICASGESMSLQIAGAGRHVVEIDVQWQKTPQLMHLSWDLLPLNSIQVQPDTEFALEPAVVVEFGSLPNSAPLALHHASCRARLKSVRMTDEQISGVLADSHLRGELRFRRAGEFEWQSEELVFECDINQTALGYASLPIAQIERLNCLLKDHLFDLVIDFGPYGGFYADALVVEEIVRHSVHIPPRLRARIEWLCKASQAFVDGERRIVNSLDDAALLRHFRTLSVPDALLANRRALERELRQGG